MTTRHDLPAIYVASLSDYNAGRYLGCWISIDEDTTANEVWEQINAMLARSPEDIAEEHAIHDHENFGGWRIPEYESIETVVAVGQFMAAHDRDAVAAWLGNRGPTDPDDLVDFESAYLGHHDSARAFTVDLIEAGWAALDADQVTRIWPYLNLQAIEGELFASDYWSAPAPGGGVFIFRTA